MKTIRRRHLVTILVVAAALYALFLYLAHLYWGQELHIWELQRDGQHVEQVMRIRRDQLADEAWSVVAREKLTGLLRLKNTNGDVLYTCEITNGYRHGASSLWDNEGKRLLMKAMYVSNSLHGSYVTWHYNGSLSHTGLYRNGVMEGEHLSWYEDGQIQQDTHYLSGTLHGRVQRWDGGGNLIEDAVYSNMVPLNGRVLIESRDGDATIGVYVDRELVEKQRITLTE